MTQCRVIGIEWPNWEPLNYILFSVYREDIRKLKEKNDKLKQHIEAKDKAYTDLLEDYEDLRKDRDNMITKIEECLNVIRNIIN